MPTATMMQTRPIPSTRRALPLAARASRMPTMSIAAVGLSFGLALGAVAQAAGPSPRDLRAAQCVAALDANTQELASQVKSGGEAARSVLLARLVSGAAFIGDAYLHGSSNERQARDLAQQAREAQKALSARELAARQAACADEGARLHAASNRLQQAVVQRLARKRMDRLLGS